MATKRLFLIDGHALCYRSFYAIRELATSAGQPTNAVYGFVNTLRKILREMKPDYVVACFDSKEKTHRSAKYAQYKIQRQAMPEGLSAQIPVIKEVLGAYHVAILEQAGYEADDLIAAVVKKLSKNDLEITVVSDDKDMYQLASEDLKFYSVRNDETYDTPALKKKLGFEPQLIVDFIGLAGDNTDNIPGVMGIGEVTARSLLLSFGSLESIYKNLSKVDKESVREKLKTQKDQAFFSKELALLEADAPVKYALDELEVKEPDRDRLHGIFRSLEFRRLAEEYASADQPQKEMAIKDIAAKAGLDELIDKIKSKKFFAFLPGDVSEQSLFHQSGLTLSIDGASVFQIEAKLTQHLKPIFKDEKIAKITYDFKSVLKEFDNEGDFFNNIFDVKLASYLAGLSYTTSTPSDLAWRYLKQSISDNNRRAHETAALTGLYPVLLKELKERELLKLHNELEVPLSIVLSKMESHGVKIDLELLASLSKECERSIGNLEKKLYKLAGQEFNLNSPKQLSQILFEKLKLPVVKKTKTGFSTDEEVLTILAKNHDVASLILEYRQLAKLKSTYIDALPKMVDAKDGRIHAEFDQIGAETGRFSSRNPNLQNIPIRTELGREIRKAFIPSKKGNVLLSADYSQIELRILAHLSQDKTLLSAFEKGEDIHNLTASLIFDVKESEVTYEMRNTAKRVNFSIIYGMSSYGLAKDLNISTPEAQSFIDTYFARYPKVKEYIERVIQECETNGYVTTILNRRRYIPDINSKNNAIRQLAQRQAINTPVQGSAADFIKLAMIKVQEQMDRQKTASRMIMTVHDELVFDVVKDEEKAMIELVRREMESPMKLSTPVKVSIKVGMNWLETKEV